MDRIVEIEKFDTEESSEITLRPDVWSEYIGQEQIKKNLGVFIEASKKREEALDHVLFFGPPGLGKTTLALIIANEMNANIKVTAAPMIEKSGDLAALLTNLEEGDILFIDEIHRLSPAVEEILYSNPLRDRFGMNFRMQFYTSDELAKIISQASLKLDKEIIHEACLEIAKRSRGTPRIALRLLRRVRDFADVANEIDIKHSRTQYALNELGINSHGFDEMDIRLLNLLVAAKGRAMGLSTIAAALSEDEGTVEDVLEPYLIANGYLERTAKGRKATKSTYEILKIPVPHTQEDLLF